MRTGGSAWKIGGQWAGAECFLPIHAARAVEGNPPSYRGQIPIIRSRGAAATAVDLDALQEIAYEFTCTYTSLSEHVYQSETEIDHLLLQSFVFRLITIARQKHSERAENRAHRAHKGR